jgi:Sulfotransferase family
MPKTYYFLHIPKTAGVTLCFSVLPKLFDPAEICPAHDYPEVLSIPPAELSMFRLFRGHFYYFFDRLLPAKPIYFTFLRDPVERTLSLYDHICRDPAHFQYNAMRALKDGLRDAVHSPELLPPNFQVTALACDLDPVSAMAAARAAHPLGLDEHSVIYGEMTRRLPTRDDLATARRRLEEMDFVGIVERFDESVQLLCSTFGWKVPAYESMNIAPARTRRDSIAPDILKALMQTHELDFELYEFAKSLFSRRL